MSWGRSSQTRKWRLSPEPFFLNHREVLKRTDFVPIDLVFANFRLGVVRPGHRQLICLFFVLIFFIIPLIPRFNTPLFLWPCSQLHLHFEFSVLTSFLRNKVNLQLVGYRAAKQVEPWIVDLPENSELFWRGLTSKNIGFALAIEPTDQVGGGCEVPVLIQTVKRLEVPYSQLSHVHPAIVYYL